MEDTITVSVWGDWCSGPQWEGGGSLTLSPMQLRGHKDKLLGRPTTEVAWARGQLGLKVPLRRPHRWCCMWAGVNVPQPTRVRH